MDTKPVTFKRTSREESASFDRSVIDYIQNAAAHGLYEIRGMGAKRKLPHFDDLVFLAGSLSRYPLEGYREKCATKTILGTRFAKKPLELDIPITIAGMSFGALSANVKEALGRAATEMGTTTTTGDGGMTQEERGSSKTLVYQCLPSRYGFNPDDVRRADAIEVVIGQGAKPGGGGMLLGQKVNPRVAKMRTLPQGVDQRSACRHPDWTGPDDLAIKIQELRELTDWEKPIYVKVGATRTFNDVKLAVHAGADVVVVDGMQGGTAATQTCYIEHIGIPTLAAVRQAVDALEDLNMKGRCSSSCRAASAAVPTSPRRWRWVPTPSPSVRASCMRWAATRKPTSRTASTCRRSRATTHSARRRASATTVTRASARSA
jgi:glutamate synthase domain-containing protein 2